MTAESISATTRLQPGPSVGQMSEHGLGRLAGWCYDHRRRVVMGWLLAVIAVIVLAQAAGSRLDNNFALAGSPSQQAQHLLSSRFVAEQGDSAQVVLHATTALGDPANAATIGRLVRALEPLAYVSGVQSPIAPGGAGQLTADRRTGFVAIRFDTVAAKLPASAVERVIATARRFARPGLQVALGGAPIEQVVSAAPGSAETIGLLAAVVVMLVAFGSVVAMGLPILIALLGVGMGFGLLEALSHLVTVPTFGPDLMVMIGLGVGIDYALFVVTRYRQSLSEGHPPRDATIVALTTAGRAVLFAGSTVVLALLGLFVVGLGFMDGLALSTIVAVALVLLGAVTLLPAIFGFTGRTIDRLHIPGLLARPSAGGAGGFWSRWSSIVQRRPWAFGLLALGVLVVLAMPLFSMRQAFSDAGNDPTSLTTRQAYDLLAEGFGPGFNGPLVVAADIHGPRASATIARLDAAIRRTHGVSFVAPPVFNAARDAAVIVVYPSTAPQSAQTASLVDGLRTQEIPQVTDRSGVTAYVGGETAAGVDTSAYLASRVPWVIGTVVLLAFLLLMVGFRSLAIALKAAAMNLLSIGAAYGVIVAVFQWGWLRDLFGTAPGPIDPWIPLMMFTVAFGLSMDYEVFLLSRMREAWLRTGDNTAAVRHGLTSSARVITAAAAIMVCVFGSFVVGDPLRILDVFGLGLAVAVFVDATVVRMVLVPAIMQLLGAANWWLPAWMQRLAPRLAVEATPQSPFPRPAGPGVSRAHLPQAAPATGMRTPWAVAISVAWGVALGGTFGCLLPYVLGYWHFRTSLSWWIVAGVAGGILLAAGLAAIVGSFVEFIRAHATPVPHASPQRLVVRGPYRYVRNPIYVGFLAVLGGEALLFGSRGLLEYLAISFCVGAAAARFYEEPILARKFGADYAAYRGGRARLDPSPSPLDSWRVGRSGASRVTLASSGQRRRSKSSDGTTSHRRRLAVDRIAASRPEARRRVSPATAAPSFAVAPVAELVGERRTGRVPAELVAGLGCAGALVEQQDFSEVVTQARPRLLIRARDRSWRAGRGSGRFGEFREGRVHSVADDVAAVSRVLFEDAPEEVGQVGYVYCRPVLLPGAEHDQVAGVVPG